MGEYLLAHPHDETCPCHRVVRADGHLGLFISGNPDDKARRLRAEGIRLRDDRVSLDESGFDAFECGAPLQSLRDLQTELAPCVQLNSLAARPRTLAGVDVSYNTPSTATAAYVLVSVPDLRCLWSTTVTLPVRFPYIPGYLSFRELPMQLALFAQVEALGHQADVTMVDGNGRLHPRRAGSATLYGLATQSCSIGVGKSLLCGRVDLEGQLAGETRPVQNGEEVLGIALKGARRGKPIFVSPGNRIDLATAVELTWSAMDGHRLPVPIRLADRLSRETSRS